MPVHVLVSCSSGGRMMIFSSSSALVLKSFEQSTNESLEFDFAETPTSGSALEDRWVWVD